MSDRLLGDGALVQFNERLTNSAAFGTLFREGMDLVEETAAYLDGVGRTEAKALDRAVGLTYATESMRLTTRLTQQLQDLINRSMSLQARVRRLDSTMHASPDQATIGNPLVPQLNRLKAAFEQ